MNLELRRGQLIFASAAGSVITAESSPSEVLVGRGGRWATIVAAAGASAEPWSPPEGMTQTKAKTGLAVREKKSQER